jgi:hypothetical protein
VKPHVDSLSVIGQNTALYQRDTVMAIIRVPWLMKMAIIRVPWLMKINRREHHDM